MRIGVVPENLLERIVLSTHIAPIPLAESWFTFHLANAIMVGVKLGVYEALADGPLDAPALAAAIGGHAGACTRLLNALIGVGHLSHDGQRYALTPIARKWLLASSPQSSRDKILFQFLERKWLEHTEEFIKTGKTLAVHSHLTDEEWGLYQRGMRSGVDMMAHEVARRLKIRAGATRMLDIGGSHGYFSVSLCRKHPGLSSVILDLPEAIVHAAPVLAKENMSDRVVHQAGNALTSDLGSEQYDLIFIGSLVHHFDDATNRALAKKCAAALRPGGVLALYDAIRLDPNHGVGQIGGLLDLFFGIISESGTWSGEEMASWQRDAGLRPRKLMRMRLVRDVGVQAAVKP
jgi:2-polyprenyl-3-methyl-5-hydroxy-6-metoxy-1,4-benzoquinol methylase